MSKLQKAKVTAPFSWTSWTLWYKNGQNRTTSAEVVRSWKTFECNNKRFVANSYLSCPPAPWRWTEETSSAQGCRCGSKRWALRRKRKRSLVSSWGKLPVSPEPEPSDLPNCPSPPGFCQTWGETWNRSEVLSPEAIPCCLFVYLTVLWWVRYFSLSCGSEPSGRWTSRWLSFIVLAGSSLWDLASMEDRDARSDMACWWSLWTNINK